jgi:5-formyltetrahydrofolate cyclo-ligase
MTFSSKQTFRKEFKMKLSKIPHEQILSQSLEVTKKLFEHEWYLKATRVSLFLNMPGEIDTSLILKDIFHKQKKCFVPICSKDSMEMVELCSWDDFLGLKKNTWGIPEPLANEKRSNALDGRGLDLIIMPGLAFDLDGNRIGYGKGYYDRYLKRSFAHADQHNLVPPVTIAIALSDQICEQVPTDPNDVKPMHIITP